MKRWYTRIGAMAHRRANEPNLPIAPTRPLQETRERLGELLGSRIARLGRSEEDQIRPGYRERAGAGSLAELALRAVAHHSVTQALSSSEGDPPGAAFAFAIAYNHAHQRVVDPPPMLEYALKIQSGLDGPHTQTRAGN